MFTFLRNRKFKKELEHALADGVLTDDEVRYLEQRSEKLGIDQEFVNNIRSDHVRKQVQPILDRVKATRRYSPDDEAELNRLAAQLRFEPELGPEFNMYRALWELENTGSMTLRPIEAESSSHARKNVTTQLEHLGTKSSVSGSGPDMSVARSVFESRRAFASAWGARCQRTMNMKG